MQKAKWTVVLTQNGTVKNQLFFTTENDANAYIRQNAAYGSWFKFKTKN